MSPIGANIVTDHYRKPYLESHFEQILSTCIFILHVQCQYKEYNILNRNGFMGGLDPLSQQPFFFFFGGGGG